MSTAPPRTAPALLDELLARRERAGEAFCDQGVAGQLARIAEALAGRLGSGGRLLAMGRGATACSDARHVAVEFVHPVIVGKRALPAMALAGEDESLDRRVALTCEPNDAVVAFGVEDAATAAALAGARRIGALTLAFAPCQADWVIEPPGDDPFVRQELTETAYHVLWELVHVFLEHGDVAGASDAGAPEAAFLYPFLERAGAAGTTDLLADAAHSAAAKARDALVLRRQTLQESRRELEGAADTLRRAFDAGGTLLAIGNGGSATDAMDMVADFREPPHRWPPRPALDLSADPAVLTAIANDVGAEAMFARQVIAFARPGDVLIAISTSGGSANVVAALAEARRRRVRTVALVGYDGGKVAAEQLADHVIVSRSQHIPRIQEAQASAYHALRELVEAPPADT